VPTVREGQAKLAISNFSFGQNVRHFTFQITLVAFLFSFAPCARAQTAISPGSPEEKLPPAKTSEELESRYFSVLAALKKPAATGLLVAELGPYSNAANAGVRPGDILVEYLGRRLDDPADKDRNTLLRNLVTRAIDEQNKKDINPLATFIVERDGKLVVLAAERMPLGIFTIPVEKNVAMPLNPLESDRGSFKTTWTASETFLRIGEPKGDNPGAASVETHNLSVSDPNATLALGARALFKSDLPAQTILQANYKFNITDRSVGPAISLENFSYADESIEISALRRGGIIRGTINRKFARVVEKVERPTLAESIPSLLVPHLAASLPLEEKIVLHFSIVSEIDLQTRPGYALETRGKTKIKINKDDKVEIEAFAVRLWHFGQPDSVFYFSAKRRLLSATSDAGGPSMARSETEADAIKSLVMIKDPAATRPLFPKEPAPGAVKSEEQGNERAIDPRERK
jgi:hypothetical protein